MQKSIATISIVAALTLSGCGGSSAGNSADDLSTEGLIYGPYSTGTASDPETVYYDLDAQSVLTLTTEEAETNTQWDIAFQRTKVWLNVTQETPVSLYFTGNNADFYDADGVAIADSFLAASADSELEDYTAVTLTDVPDSAEFSTDVDASVIGDSFYNYDFTTHVVSAADDAYCIVNSDENYTRFRVTDIQTVDRLIGEITFEIEHQSILDGQSSFASPVVVTLQTEACAQNSYVDFATQTTVGASDAWDLMLTCGEGGAEFSLTLADDATVIKSDGQTYTGIDSAAAPYMGFTSDSFTEYAFDANSWYYYDSTSHLLYSQFGVYLIQVGTNTYKFQITSYYDDEGTSGSYSFRADLLSE